MTDFPLTIITEKNVAEYFVDKGLDPIIDKIRDEVKDFVPDITSEEGRKACASMAYKVARSKTIIDDLGKKLVAGIKAQAKVIDAERSRAWDIVEGMQKDIRKPLTDWEEAEEKRVAGHKEALLAVESAVVFESEPTAFDVKNRIAALFVMGTRPWDEFAEMGKAAIEKADGLLNRRLEQITKADAERAELERLRKEAAEREQKDRDDKMKAEAAEAAKVAAEKAARETIDRADREKREADERAKKAEDDKKAAEEKARTDAAIAAAQAERDKEAAVQREKDRAAAEKKALDDAAAAREADKAHQAKINNEALKAIAAVIETDQPATMMAQAIVSAIAKGQIPNVKIFY